MQDGEQLERGVLGEPVHHRGALPLACGDEVAVVRHVADLGLGDCLDDGGCLSLVAYSRCLLLQLKGWGTGVGRSGVLAFDLPDSLAWPKSLLEQLENRQIQIARATFRQRSRDRQRPQAHPLDQSLPVR